MDSWLEDPTGQTLAVCEACGREWDRADMLEAHFPRLVTSLNGVSITPLTLCWVGPCCASLADPEEAP